RWGVKWELVGLGCLLLLGGGIPALIFYLTFNSMKMWLLAVAFTGLLVALFGLMGEGAKW
ncbi:MAG: hypothetical protein AAGA30_10795, partial [Planctomycetota bacterium]